MKRTHAVGAAALAALTALALTACGSDDNSGGTPSEAPTSAGATSAMETTPTVTVSGTLNGGGSSAQANAEKAWIAGFQTANSAATVNYSSTDSGAGRTAFIQGSQDFAGSDAALSTDELTSAQARCYGGNALDLPIYISPIAVAFNIPGVTTLNMKPDVVAKIFDGKITTWDDPAITADNPGATLSGPITVAHRSDDSGTSKNFQDYLSKAAPDAWSYPVGNTWPAATGQGGNGTQGVVQIIEGAAGTIGYIDASALTGTMGTVSVGVGSDFVGPTADAAATAVAASPLDSTRGTNDLVVNIDRTTTTAGAYPAVLVSYLVVCDTYDTQAKADLVKAYASYVASSDGQSAAASAAGSAPIASDLASKVQTAVDSIKAKA